MAKKKIKLPSDVNNAANRCNDIYQELGIACGLIDTLGVFPTPAQERVKGLLEELERLNTVLLEYWNAQKDSKVKKKELKVIKHNKQITKEWRRFVEESVPEDRVKIEIRF